jgi:hypothetical protein
MNVINRIAPDITVLADALEVPGIGFLPVNAFVLHAREAVGVDTGLSLPGRRFLEAVGSAIDPVMSNGSGSPTPTVTTPEGCSIFSTPHPGPAWSARSSGSESCPRNDHYRWTGSTCSILARPSTSVTVG